MAERVTIARLGANGDGVVDRPGGPLYVPGALPGEVVLVAIDRDRGRVLERETSSPDRAEPFCPYFGTCGGCVAQHVGPGLYPEWKRGKVAGALAKAGIAAEVGRLVDGHGEGRRRVTFHAREIEGEMQVGFMEARSHHLVRIARCPITVEALAGAPQAASALAARMKGIGKPLDLAVTATLAGLDIDLRGSGRLEERRRQALIAEAGALGLARLSLHGETLVEFRRPAILMGRAHVAPPAGGFLQATAKGEEALAAIVLEGCRGAKRVADLFAGSGPFSLRLGDVAEVHAVESDRAALAALDRAARGTPGLRRITTEIRDLFRRPLLAPELDRFDAVVLDPPRAGAEAQCRQLTLSSPDTVVMVSCDPGTFARDAAILMSGGFSPDAILPVDQFAWSAHVEIAAVFRRRRTGRRRR
ncbi:class I SAM-dependent RNA methyltransferase [Enterovirga aerilata]|uniref:Class I SAM-dependent RNA methyltransferase n=1 Tax=Enterovirga aerilata TaxID=2730920 RepID=A0A849IBR7_9HYPH|nr:class I SAM-dependent RNA methyltransferase [Enterovirga sp. DB1703]NNM74848.1 class I SAM-dependent RNA methyltransferase [Enterovirga sp. DB1703]